MKNKSLLNKTLLTVIFTCLLIGSFSISVLAANDVKYNYAINNNSLLSIQKGNNKKENFYNTINSNNLISSNNKNNSISLLGSKQISYNVSLFAKVLNADLNNTTLNFDAVDINTLVGYLTSNTIGSELDSNYPLFAFCNTRYFLTADTVYSNANDREIACISFNDVGSALSTNAANNTKYVINILASVVDAVIGTSLSNNSNIVSVDFGSLYSVGYRFYQVSYSNDLGGYLYILGRYKYPDNYEMEGNARYYTTQDTQYFLRIDFKDVNVNTFNNNQISYYQVSIPTSNLGNLLSTNTMIYDLNNVEIVNISSSSITLNVYPSNNSYITLFRYLSFYNNATSFNSYSISANLYQDSDLLMNSSSDYNNQLNTINSNLILIKDLISDFEVNEINNIYTNIINNYNIDIDTEINDLIGDLNIDINSVDFDDPKFNISSDGIGKLGVFKTITNSIISVYDNNNISLLYFVPFVLFIIGAIVL